MTSDDLDALDSLDGDSRAGENASTASQVEDDHEDWLAPDEMLEQQRRRYSFKRKPGTKAAQRRKKGELFVPSLEWLRAWDEQMTADTRATVRKYACWRAEMYKGVHMHLDDDAIDEWIHKAIADTLDGTIRWKHETIKLAYHLKDTIRLRTWREMERSKKFRHVSLDDKQEDPHDEGPQEEEPTAVEAALSSKRGHRERDELPTSDFQQKLLAAMRERCAKDGEIMAILGALDRGLTERAEICEDTGITEEQFHNARRRMGRQAIKLSDELKALAMEAMVREPD